MLTLKQGIRLSAIIDKLDLSIRNPEGTQEQVGADLMMQVVGKAHRAENEIYAFVSEIKKIDIEEAQEVDLIPFIKELFMNSEVASFFNSAVKSNAQG